MSLFSWLGNVAGGLERQVNVLDDNKTYKNKKGSGSGRSTISQAKDIGWGFLKSAAKPFVAAGADVSNTIGNAEVELAHKLGLAKNVKTQTNKQQFGEALGEYAGENTPRNFAANTAEVGLSFLAPGVGKGAAALAEKAGLAGTAGKIATAAGTGAAIGAPFGAIDTVTHDQPITVESLLRGAGYGAAGGALLGTAGEALHLGYQNRTPLNQVGAVGRNVSKEEASKLAKTTDVGQVKKQLQDLVPPDKIDAVAPAVAQAKDSNIVRTLIHEASTDTETAPHVQKFVQDYGDALKQMEGGLRGGDKVRTAEGGFVRTSEHTPFYRNFYSDHGRAPTKGEWHQEAQRQLQSGKADPFAQKEYDALKSPEVSSLLTQGPDYYAEDTSVGNLSQPEVPTAALPARPPGSGPPAGPGQDIHAASIPSGDRSRGYLTKAQSAENINPQVQEGLAEVTPQTYTPKSNDKLAAKTKSFVDKNPEGAVRRVFGDTNNPARYDEDVMIGGHLIQRAQASGKIEEAVKIAERLDTKGRDLGRGVQAYAAISRLNPEGILVYAQRQIRKAREGQKDFSNEAPTAGDIKKQVEGFTPEEGQVVKTAVQDTVGELAGAPKGSTGEQLAKRVEKAASPATKKKANVLVNELTKRVKQEYLEPKANVQTPPLKILQEVFGRNKEAQEAYPVAQQILRGKYAGDETMSAALDKFFGSDLGPIPAASSTINKAIADQLRAKQVQVSKAIYKSWANQRQTVEDVTQALTKEGFDPESAKVLATEVTSRLNKQFAEAKAKTLERLAADVPEKARTTFIDKVNKLSNIGALDKADYIDLARAKLNLPNLSPETASQLSDLAQHIQTLPEGAEKYSTVRQMKQLIEANTPLTGKQRAAQAIGTPRALMASGDLSFGGRQALAYATAHPVKFAQQWGKQFKYFKEGFQGDDSRAFDELMGEIQSHPDYELLKNSDLAITDPFGISPQAREEQFIGSHFAEKIPAIGRLVRGSNYAFTGLANSLRANEFYAQIAHAREADLPLSEKLVNDLSKVINNGTGRGSAKALEGHMQSLSTALFAPRLILSRLQTLNPHYYVTLEPAARREALRQLMGLSAFATGTLTLASQVPGVQVGLNPKSSDFGKVKIGDTRLDFLAGYGQYIRLASQLATGETVSSLSGRSSQLGSGYGKKSRKDIVAKFLENKENPVVSFGTTLLAGQDAVGNPVKTPGDISKQVLSRFVPLVFQDIADMKTHDKGLNPLLGGPLAAVGIGTQTYGKQDIKLSDKQQATVDALKQSGAPKEQIAANKDFYQTLKTTPDRNAASDKINKVLETGDYEKARQIADDYNASYASTFKEWAKKYGRYEDGNLRKEYNANKIILTSGNIRSRINNIRKNSLTTATLGG